MYQNLIGKRFGKLLVVSEVPMKQNKAYRWLCKCDCGKKIIVKNSALKEGIVKSCGCEYGKNLIGLKFGKLEIVDKVFENKHTLYLCKCECGNFTKQRFSTLKRGDVKSCGCLGKEFKQKGNVVHNLYYSRIYKIYNGMKNRCYCKTDYHYENWGKRGITICDEWLGKNGFINFYNWAISNGYNDNLSIDRIDNNGSYEPSNCRWTTKEVQQNNTRRNKKYEYNGEALTLSQLSKKYQINVSTLYHRIKKFNDIKIAIENPINLSLSRTKK